MEYVLPSTKTIQLGSTPTAGQTAKIKAGDLKVDLTASPTLGAYPITITTFVLVRASMPANDDVANVLSYFLGKTAQSQPLVAGLRAAVRAAPDGCEQGSLQPRLSLNPSKLAALDARIAFVIRDPELP